ncbi:DUF1446-domain-containing protein [Massarina eburnea CBS 473.64]|uniref:DUF1446-domain-containing protein n=1 Tax=Massarina eburnea CBS 473.64 TaxID=1395130 RepID=A0A6A6SHK7_9PLEO|nr:DUF1446-domain-containing protein [Massarina eburnea CBS 473.64]
MGEDTSFSQKRPIRIAGASGAATDRRDAFRSLAHNYPIDPVDVIVGDWMSEANMTYGAGRKVDQLATTKGKNNDSDPQNASSNGNPFSQIGTGFEPTFLEAIEPALEAIDRYGIKVAVNAGNTDVEALKDAVSDLIAQKGLGLKVAWIEGDEVLETVNKLRDSNSSFANLCTGASLTDWKFDPIYAACYLGGLGIAAAFDKGADIVLCGRVSDASPVIGAAYWWHNWKRSDLLCLANALVAGHLIECSTYVTGGNFTGFKSIAKFGIEDIGYPIAEIGADGSVVVTKQKGPSTGGAVTVDTCTAQLLYEIQGPLYFNSDVTAVLNGIHLEQVRENRVAVHGVKALPPPPTTKVGITARGGFQAEFYYFLTGLDILEKATMLEAQIRRGLKHSHAFTTLKFSTHGAPPANTPSQDRATVFFRIFAQAPEQSDLAPAKFARPCLDVVMQSYPGATFHLDVRQAAPHPYFEYFVTLLPQSSVKHVVHPPPSSQDPEPFEIAAPMETQVHENSAHEALSPSTSLPIDLLSLGPTTSGPLGRIVHARSGDKGSDANVGFWVQHRDEYDWLRTLLSTETVISLLGEEYKDGNRIERFELPGLKAVHFLLKNHLDRGVSSTSSVDFLGKNVAEFLRSRWVELPNRFLARSMI